MNYTRAEHGDGVTLWLLLAVMDDLLSLAAESRRSNMLSSLDSVLQQQVHLTETMRSDAAKGCQLAGKCSNKVENTASPRLIAVCESVHAVKRKGKLNKKNTFYNDNINVNTVFTSSLVEKCKKGT